MTLPRIVKVLEMIAVHPEMQRNPEGSLPSPAMWTTPTMTTPWIRAHGQLNPKGARGTRTTTYAGYSYGLNGYILKVTAEDAAGTPGLTLTGLPDDTRALVAETVELVMKGLGLARFNRRMPGTIVRYERMDAADPRPENLDRFELRSLGGATTLAVIAEHQQELQIKTEGRTLGPEHLTATVIAANILPELTHIWDSKMISTRGIAGIAHAASQAGLRILTATANGPVAENVHPFPRSVSAETLSNAVTILTGEAPPVRPVEKETWETQKTRSHEHRLDGERDITPEQLRILEIAVTGPHNLCITTPERSITTSRYAAIASDLMPELGWTESAEATRIHSAALLPAPHERRVRHAPMRAPQLHHVVGRHDRLDERARRAGAVPPRHPVPRLPPSCKPTSSSPSALRQPRKPCSTPTPGTRSGSRGTRAGSC